MNKQSRLWFFRATPTLVINCIFPVCFMTSCADRGLNFGSFMRGSCQVMSVGGGKTTYGTGFCVESFDGILTNYHVIEEGDTIYVKHYSSNKWYECENRAFSESDDLCLIKPLGQYENPFLPMRKSSAVSLGETVYTVGNIDNLGLSLGRGIVSSRYKSLSYRGKVNSFIQTDIEIYDVVYDNWSSSSKTMFFMEPSLWEQYCNQVGYEAMWLLNKAYLNYLLVNPIHILLTNNPYDYFDEISGYGSELRYLSGRGCSWTLSSVTAPGGLSLWDVIKP